LLEALEHRHIHAAALAVAGLTVALAQHRLHQVDTEDELGDAMLDLQPAARGKQDDGIGGDG